MAIVGKWGLNGNANALVGPNGTTTNVTWVDGKSNGAGSFNGSNSKIIINNTLGAVIGDKTINAFIKINTNNNWQEIFGQKRFGGASSYDALEFRGTNTGKLQYAEANYSVNTNITSTETLNINTWYMVTVTVTGGTAKLYINGVNTTNGNITRINNFTVDTNGNGIGVFPNFNGSDIYFFNGLIDEVEIHNTALTPAEIKNKYLFLNGFI